MSSSPLRNARQYEAEHKESLTEETRPCYHMSVPIGWMNDPNGLSIYKSEYHMFYQYHPYDAVWGYIHWEHVKSKDLVCWEYLPASFPWELLYRNERIYQKPIKEIDKILLQRNLILSCSDQRRNGTTGSCRTCF